MNKLFILMEYRYDRTKEWKPTTDSKLNRVIHANKSVCEGVMEQLKAKQHTPTNHFVVVEFPTISFVNDKTFITYLNGRIRAEGIKPPTSTLYKRKVYRG